jgi:hypothetical protein
MLWTLTGNSYHTQKPSQAHMLYDQLVYPLFLRTGSGGCGVMESEKLHGCTTLIRKSADLSYLPTAGSFHSSNDNLTRRVHFSGFWSLGQSEYKVYHSSIKTILCNGRWNSESKSRGKFKGIWT